MNLKQYIDKHPFSVVIFFFVLLYAWQPFFAGMYSDDWGFLLSYFTENAHPQAPFSLDRLTHFMKVYANRPLSGVMYYIVNSICDYNLFMVNSIMIIVVLITIFCFYLFAKELFTFLQFKKSKFVSSLASLTWLFSPWTLGVTVWYSSSINLLAIIFFSLSMSYFFRGLNQKKSYIIRASIFYLLSCLTYESFFFQYFIFIAIAWLFKSRKSISKSILIRHSINLSAIVVLVVVWNRIAPEFFSGSINKVFNPYFLKTIVANIVSFPYVYIKSFGALDIVVLLLMLLALGYIIVKIRKSETTFSEIIKNKQIMIILLLLSGILAGVVLYSAAGYTFWGLGSRSRTMFVASFYIPLIAVILFDYLHKLNLLSTKLIKSAILVALVVSFTATLLNKIDWVKADNLQRKTISEIPLDKFESLDSNDMVLVVAPFRSNWISVIDAPWAVNYQMKYGYSFYFEDELHKISNARFAVGRGLVHPVTNQYYENYWDGQYLYQGYNLKENASDLTKNFYFSRLDRFRANRLFVWNYYDGSFNQVISPQILEYKPFYNYDYWITWIYNNWVK